MTKLYSEIEVAVSETLASADDQSREFKRRVRKLIENAMTGNLADDDVREVIELVTVEDELED